MTVIFPDKHWQAVATLRHDLPGFTDRAMSNGTVVSNTVVRADHRWPNAFDMKFMGTDSRQKIWHLIRVRNENKAPVAYEITHVRHDFQAPFDPAYSLYSQLRSDGISPTKCLERVEARVAPEHVCQCLSIPQNSALLLIERLVFDESERPVEYTQGWYNKPIAVELT